MGEYAKYNGQDIKIGTCEDMYYLRADQTHLIQPDSKMGLNPNSNTERKVIRFRFPFPDEDDIAPGEFDNPFRAVAIHGFTPSNDFEHSSIQFKADAGYLISLPCPESQKANTPGFVTQMDDGLRDADYHTRELAMIAGLKADGIDIGPPTRQHFTIEDCQAMAVRS